MSIRGLKNCSQIVTLAKALEKDGRNLVPGDLTIVSNGAVVYDDQSILWVGPTDKIPKDLIDVRFRDMTGHVVTPTLVDSHTHLVFGGDRSTEYVERLNGKSY